MAKQPYKLTKLSEIRPYDRNPRVIPQAAVDAVAKSIAAFGFRQPIVVDGDGVILAGHTRYKAAQQLGLEVVPVVWQTDITPIQARGYRIADNKTAEISAWDRDALDAEVRELADRADVDLEALGLPDWELGRILSETGTSMGNAFQALENELLAGGAQTTPASQACPIGAPQQTEQSVCTAPLKMLRVLVTIPRGNDTATEEALDGFLKSLTEMVAGFPGGKTETF